MERQVLRKIIKLGKRIPAEAQKRIYVGDGAIIRVDFFYKPDCLLFVDEPDHVPEPDGNRVKKNSKG